jgi:hypothetical protein
LREELAARNLDSKGLKSQLASRLKEALDEEMIKTEATEDLEKSASKNDVVESIKNEGGESMKSEDNQIEHSEVKKSDKAESQTIVEESPAEITDEPQPVQPNLNSKLSKLEREKYYKLPSTPHLIVHPSSTAKGGKIDLELVTLSTLLDYRKDDSKESAFEVSLFAEAFNEMIMRDNAFNIYKSILSSYGEKNEIDKPETSTPTTTNATTLKRKTADENDDTDSDQIENSEKRVKHDHDKDDDDEKLIIHDGPVLNVATNRNMAFLLAFAYFDSHRYGYIYEKELEDLICCIGLALSKAKIRTIIEKSNIMRDGRFNYRSFNDKQAIKDSSSFKFELPNDEEIVANDLNCDTYSFSNEPREQAAPKQQDTLVSVNFVEINGAVVDVRNTVKRLDKSEQLNKSLELKLKDTNEQLSMFGLFFFVMFAGKINGCICLRRNEKQVAKC